MGIWGCPTCPCGDARHANVGNQMKEGGDGYYYFVRKETKVDLERKLEAAKLFSDKKKHDEIAAKLVKDLESTGFIEKENELDGTYKVLTSFHYMENLVDCITISEEVQDEIPE